MMMSGERRSGVVIFRGGIFLPLAITTLVLVNAVQGKVYFPVDRSPPYLVVSTVPMVVQSVMVMKLGLAWLAFAWNLLANIPRVDRYALINVIRSCGVILLGFVGMIYGFSTG